TAGAATVPAPRERVIPLGDEVVTLNGIVEVQGADGPEYRAGNCRRTLARCAADVAPEEVGWLYRPWVPVGALTLLSGPRGCGKSTFAAGLASASRGTAYLPGREEAPGRMTNPRLLAQGVDLRRVVYLDGEDVTFPADRRKVADAVRAAGADLLLIDPVRS